MFRVGKLSIHWKRIRIMSPAMHVVCTRTNSLLAWLNTCCRVPVTCVCVHVTSILTVFMSWNSEIQSLWLDGITCAWLARLLGTTSNEEGLKEREMHTQSVCVCVPMLHGHMLLNCSDILSCPNLRLTKASTSSWGGRGGRGLNSKYLFIFWFLYWMTVGNVLCLFWTNQRLILHRTCLFCHK